MRTPTSNKAYIYEMSLSERLLDNEPQQLHDAGYHHLVSLEDLFVDIRINLENILNTRSKEIVIPTFSQALNHSLLNYGISDFSHKALQNPQVQRELCAQIKLVIERFETRLHKVRVEVLGDVDELERILHLCIAGVVNVRPSPKRVVFESKMDAHYYQFSLDEAV